MTQTIAITAPTGNVGSKLPAFVREAKQLDLKIVVLARKPEKVSYWADAGATVHGGRMEDKEFVAEATQGVDALYWATPNSFPPELTMCGGYRMFAESAAHAIKTNKIAHTVHLSGFAHVDDGGGEKSLLRALAQSEEILGKAVEALQAENPGETFGITHLRAGFFFENLLGQLESIREKGRIYLPVDRSVKIPMVASHDIAEKVAENLLLRPSGRVFKGAWGPRDMSFSEVATALTEGLERKITVCRLPQFMIRWRMLNMGRDPRTTDAFMVTFKAITNGKVMAEPARDESNTTRMSMELWAKTFLKPVVEGRLGEACPARVQYEAPEVPASKA